MSKKSLTKVAKIISFTSRGEKVFLDFLDDFLGLGDSLGNDFFHHFHDSFIFDLHCSSNFLDLGTPL